MGYFGKGVPKHDHSNDQNGGSLSGTLLIAALTLTGAISGTTGYFTGSVGAQNVTASSMTVSGTVQAGTLKFSDGTTMITSPLDQSAQFNAVAISTLALASSVNAVAISTGNLALSTAAIASTLNAVTISTGNLALSTAAIASTLNAVAISTGNLALSTATLAAGTLISSQTTTGNYALANASEVVISTVSMLPIITARKIKISGIVSLVRIAAGTLNWQFQVRRSTRTRCAIGSPAIDSTHIFTDSTTAAGKIIAPLLWVDSSVSTDTHFYCITARQDSGAAQRVSTRTFTLEGNR